MNINHQRQPKYKKENSKCHPSRDHESQEFRGGKDTKLETGGWRGGKRLEQQPREGFEKERLVNKVKLYKEGGELGLLDLASSKPSRSQRMEGENQTANGERDRGTAEKGHREGRESRTPTPTIRRDAHSGEGSRDPVLPGAKLSPDVPGSATETDVRSTSSGLFKKAVHVHRRGFPPFLSFGKLDFLFFSIKGNLC